MIVRGTNAAQADTILTATTSGLTDPRICLLTSVNGKTTGITESDLLSGTYVEASYSGYARVQVASGEFRSITTNGTTFARERLFPSAEKLFVAIPSGSVTVVAWGLCDGTGALSTALKRIVDTAFSKTYAATEQPKVAVDSFTASVK